MNIARMRGSPNDLVMGAMMARIDDMNRLAEQSKGFIWRIHGDEVSAESLRVFENYFTPFEPERLFYNMSVWETADDLKNYVYRSAHAEMFRRKDEWTEHFNNAHLALWWIPRGHRPTVAESAERLRKLDQLGPTAFAFTLKKPFPNPASG